jgi:hypothetical protein
MMLMVLPQKLPFLFMKKKPQLMRMVLLLTTAMELQLPTLTVLLLMIRMALPQKLPPRLL